MTEPVDQTERARRAIEAAGLDLYTDVLTVEVGETVRVQVYDDDAPRLSASDRPRKWVTLEDPK